MAEWCDSTEGVTGPTGVSYTSIHSGGGIKAEPSSGFDHLVLWIFIGAILVYAMKVLLEDYDWFKPRRRDILPPEQRRSPVPRHRKHRPSMADWKTLESALNPPPPPPYHRPEVSEAQAKINAWALAAALKADNLAEAEALKMAELYFKDAVGLQQEKTFKLSPDCDVTLVLRYLRDWLKPHKLNAAVVGPDKNPLIRIAPMSEFGSAFKQHPGDD